MICVDRAHAVSSSKKKRAPVITFLILDKDGLSDISVRPGKMLKVGFESALQ